MPPCLPIVDPMRINNLLTAVMPNFQAYFICIAFLSLHTTVHVHSTLYYII